MGGLIRGLSAWDGRVRRHHHVVRYILTSSEGKASKRGGESLIADEERQEKLN